THPHDDHVSGLIDVIKRYKVEKILYTGVVHSSPNYLVWLELIRDRKIPLTIIDRPQIIEFGENCELQIIYPRESLLGKEVSNLNNSSIVIQLVYGQTKFLLAGDIELEAEQELLASGIDLSANIFKANHHGSDTSNSKEFLQAVQPEIVVIQVGDNNFGHPSRRVIKRLERIGAQVFRNDLDGTVKLISDGKEVNIKNN
ncbi:MBL fold metallo-hydrolase, partial [Candidatus Parcubacteria bacterium]|nr:MBL fold metallo-hydrolase [Candidatus Parcubacteria bacterium]